MVVDYLHGRLQEGVQPFVGKAPEIISRTPKPKGPRDPIIRYSVLG